MKFLFIILLFGSNSFAGECRFSWAHGCCVDERGECVGEEQGVRRFEIIGSASDQCLLPHQLLERAKMQTLTLAQEQCRDFSYGMRAREFKVITLKAIHGSCWAGVASSIAIEVQYECVGP